MLDRFDTIGITDAGGRGSALVHKYSQSRHVGRIVAVPGNNLMGINVAEGVQFTCDPTVKLAAENARAIADALCRGGVTLADVCQDDAVAGGVVNELIEREVDVIGPTKEAGMVESDKAWSRAFMARNGIPHPLYRVFSGEEEGIAFLRGQPESPWVIKAAGLAQGKGVIIARDADEAIAAVKRMKEFGSAGQTYLIEQFLHGEEFSTYAVCDGAFFQMLGSAQDHKRLNDGDVGPNTGGMGCVSQPLVITPEVMVQVNKILRLTFDGMRKEGNPYTGVLYLGGMVVDGKVYVIEYNARWGDPEAQVIVPGLQSDIVELGRAVVEQRIGNLRVRTDERVRVAVALASRGYPDDYSTAKGKQIFGIEDARKQPGVTVYGAGVKRQDEKDYVAGGRLLYVVGEGADVNKARDVAYGAMDRIKVEDGAGHFRTDIGMRDVTRLGQKK